MKTLSRSVTLQCLRTLLLTCARRRVCTTTILTRAESSAPLTPTTKENFVYRRAEKDSLLRPTDRARAAARPGTIKMLITRRCARIAAGFTYPSGISSSALTRVQKVPSTNRTLARA